MTNIIMMLFLSNVDLLLELSKPEGPSEAITTALTKGRAHWKGKAVMCGIHVSLCQLPLGAESNTSPSPT